MLDAILVTPQNILHKGLATISKVGPFIGIAAISQWLPDEFLSGAQV